MGIRTYAQNFEDVLLWRALGDVANGFFIDVGAQHPIKDSVTKSFSEAGWHGIHVEPVPEYAALLRQDRPRDQVVQAVVASTRGTTPFFAIPGTGLSTGQRHIAEAHRSANFEHAEIIVPTIQLDDLLDAAPGDDIHFLKIDVEGMERQVLESWQHASRRPWIVVIEANYPGSRDTVHADWDELVLEKGYHFVYYDGLNRFYVSDARPELDRHFTLPPNIFDGFQLDWVSDFAILLQREHAQEAADLQASIAVLKQAVQDAHANAETVASDADARVEAVRQSAKAACADRLAAHQVEAESRLAQAAARESAALAEAAARIGALTEKAMMLSEVRSLLEARVAEQDVAIADAANRIGALTERAGSLERAHADLEAAAAAREAVLLAEAAQTATLAVERADAAIRAVERQRDTALGELDAARRAERLQFEGMLAQLHETLVRHGEQALRRETALRADALSRERKAEREAARRARLARRAAAKAQEARERMLLDAAERDRAGREAQFRQELRATIERFEQREAALAGEAKAAREARQAALNEAANLERAIRAELAAEKQAHESAHAKWREENLFLATELSRGNQYMARVFGSRSWRFAAPLRHLFGERFTLEDRPEEVGLSILPDCTAHAIPVSGRAIEEDVSMKSEPVTIIDVLALPAHDFITQAFVLLSGSPPDPMALRVHESALRMGSGRLAALGQIHASPAARDHRARIEQTGTDADFIEATYQRYLGRSADPEGQDHYQRVIAKKGRARAAADILASSEAALAGTLPGEVERLVGKKRHGRWWSFWRKFRDEQHLQFEIMANAARPGMSNMHVSPALAFTPPAGAFQHNSSPSPLAAVNDQALGRHGLTILNRLRAQMPAARSAF